MCRASLKTALCKNLPSWNKHLKYSLLAATGPGVKGKIAHGPGPEPQLQFEIILPFHCHFQKILCFLRVLWTHGGHNMSFKHLRQILKCFNLFHITICLIHFGIYLFAKVSTVHTLCWIFNACKIIFLAQVKRPVIFWYTVSDDTFRFVFQERAPKEVHSAISFH